MQAKENPTPKQSTDVPRQTKKPRIGGGKGWSSSTAEEEIPEPTSVFEVEKGKTSANLAALEDTKNYLAKMVDRNDGHPKEDAKALWRETTRDFEIYEAARQQKEAAKALAKDAEKKREAEKIAERKKAHIDQIAVPGSGPVGAPRGLGRHDPIGTAPPPRSSLVAVAASAKAASAAATAAAAENGGT